jgi:hypothetical protein
MITAISSIATQQAHATTATIKAITQLLNYCATPPDAGVHYYSRNKAQSRAAGYHYLSNNPPKPDQPPAPNDPSPPMNGAIVVPCKVMCEVLLSSASKAELATLFYNGKEGAPLHITLEELGHPQPPTPMVTYNSMVSGIVNESVKQKCSKAMDMRFY